MSFVLWLVAARAQSVPNGDFEVAGGWVDTSLECRDPLDGLPPFCDPNPIGFSLDATHARGALAGSLGDEIEPGTWYYDEFEAQSAPFLITRTRLTWAQFPATVGTAVLVGLAPGIRLAGAASTDVFTHYERDIGAGCGTTGVVKIDSSSRGPVWYDDVALGGSVCPEFVDVDGDGLCALGADLDGNGDCAADDEALLPGDCDDADPLLGRCLGLAFDPWLRLGTSTTFEVTDATPGDRVAVLVSQDLGASCPAELGGQCTGLADPRVLGRGVADAGGNASIAVTLPSHPEFVGVHVQAVSESALSALVPAWTLPRSRGPGADRGGVFNGGFDEDAVGWPPKSQAFYYNIGYDDISEDCPAPEQVASPARGTGALSIGADSGPARTQCRPTARPWPFLVTHRALEWVSTPGGSVGLYGMDDDLPRAPTVLGPADGGDGFDEYVADLGGQCGEKVRLELVVPYNHAPVVWDEFRLGGPVCPEFVDADGDGRCEAGADRDGDGFCVSRGEPDALRPRPLPVERLIADFETEMFETFGADEVRPIRTKGERSAYVDPDINFGWLFLQTPEIVTHRKLVVQATTLGEGDWYGAQFSLEVAGGDSPYWYPEGPGIWTQVAADVSSQCGGSIDEVDLYAYSDTWMYGFEESYHQGDWILWDDVGFAGDPCPEFVDGDGDGACAEGIDIDGDGLCVSTDEPTPGVVTDPDE